MPGNPLHKSKERKSNNQDGKNGADNGNWPEEPILKSALEQYAKEELSIEYRLLRLKQELGLRIGKTTLSKLNNLYSIPSVRKKPAQELADQLVLNKMSDLSDKGGTWGVLRTKASLAKDGTPLPRDLIREIKRLHEPEAVDARYPGKKRSTIPRGNLSSIGPFAEVNCDGHEKLGSMALQMGPVGIPIYGMKDKFSRAMLHLVVVPHDRLETTIGHVYLDFVEMFGVIPVQITTDKGSEVGIMERLQGELRNTYAPDLAEDKCPSMVKLTSTHNVPIEGAWHWFREQTGKNLFYHITQGKDLGIFNPNHEVHVQLFYWIWPPVVQKELDNFRDSWNMHTIRYQKDISLPTGSTPNMFFTVPESFGGKRVAIAVPIEAIEDLRDTIHVPREEAFRWVSDEFAVEAGAAYSEIGNPPIDVGTAWDVFEKMIRHLI